jgi:hypothetical protein
MTDIVAELRRAHPQSEDGELRHRAAAEIERLLAEVAENEAFFQRQWDANMRGIKLWQEAHPGNDLTWPDKAQFTFWMLSEIAKLRAALKNVIDAFPGSDFGGVMDRARAALTKEKTDV